MKEAISNELVDSTVGTFTDGGVETDCRKENDDEEEDINGDANEDDAGISNVRVKRSMKSFLERYMNRSSTHQ